MAGMEEKKDFGVPLQGELTFWWRVFIEDWCVVFSSPTYITCKLYPRLVIFFFNILIKPDVSRVIRLRQTWSEGDGGRGRERDRWMDR